MKIGLVSLGCPKNLVDSETMLGLIHEQQITITNDPAEADLIIINTCGFIESAKEESINTILQMGEYKTTGTCKYLIITGCLGQRYAQQGIIYSRILKMRGIGESSVAAQLDDIITSQSNPTIAIYARRGEIIVRITAKASDVEEAKSLISGTEAQIYERLSKFIYGVDDASLAEYLGQELLKSGSTIAFAESCTGGLASSMITDIPGSSEYLLGSVVTYSNMAKQKLVNVSAENLEKYGAVSEQVACEMASGVRDLFGTTYGVGITGIAGPGGATEEKPVGLVYMAVADGNDVHCVKHLFGGTRTENKLRSALTAISMVIDKIKARRNEEI